MRVLWHLHGFPPYHNAGAERYALEVLQWLRARGHQVEVILRGGAPHDGTYDGIPITNRGPTRWLHRIYDAADVALTHLDETRHAVNAATATGTPLVHILHNDRQLEYHGVTDHDLAVANSEWIRLRTPPPAITVLPPCPPDAYAVPRTGDNILFVNPIVSKGAALVYELARRHPELPFLIVAGAYGKQLPPPDLPNLELWHTTPDPRDFYAEARLVLMPSPYESFGRVAIEAAASGIPTIARPTLGLLEALGTAAAYAGRPPDPAAWHGLDDDAVYELALQGLDEFDAELTALTTDTDRYEDLAARARARSVAVWRHTEGQLLELEHRLEELAN